MIIEIWFGISRFFFMKKRFEKVNKKEVVCHCNLKVLTSKRYDWDSYSDTLMYFLWCNQLTEVIDVRLIWQAGYER